MPIPLRESPASQAGILASCAAILLPGSPADVDPARYGQQAEKECAARDAEREAADNLLLKDAFAQAKPILGICYGLQSLNVWRRGTLIQDLPHAEAARPTVNHQPGREVQRAHPVLLTPGSRLSHVVTHVVEDGEPGLFVNSSHHQAIDRPPALLQRRVEVAHALIGTLAAFLGDLRALFYLIQSGRRFLGRRRLQLRCLVDLLDRSHYFRSGARELLNGCRNVIPIMQASHTHFEAPLECYSMPKILCLSSTTSWMPE